jgi:3-hydroxyacyl-CoA dehydrogenase/enoyl-CoA hydratase/3-hydroxybutyryl-CoA epimerase
MTTIEGLTHFQFEVSDDGVATVLLDVAGERMNTLGPVIYDDFAAVLDRLETDDSIRAIVLGSAKPTNFLAGADIRIFGMISEPSQGEEVIRAAQELYARLEALHAEKGKPVVAAIHGACLGGGLELALTASMRIATDHPKTSLGQPEVRVGVLPAAGGTQRLPELIGIAAALDLILTGRSVRVRRAHKLGLVDEVVPTEVLLDVAQRRARQAVENGTTSTPTRSKSWLSPATLQQLALEQTPMGRRMLFSKAEEKMLEETRGNYPAQPRALEAVRIGVEEGHEAGYDAEARFFGELVLTPESKALQWIFFADQMLKKETWVPGDVEAKPVDKVAVLGGGLMGGGIAAVSVTRAGATTRIKEIDDAGVGRGLAYVRKVLDGQVKRRRMRKFEAEKAMNRVTGSTDWSGFGNTDLVIEAVFESLELKQTLLREMEGITPEDTVFASNTSSIPISDIAAASSRPETVLGMHYFSPVEKMPLLEVIATEQTADWALATAVQSGKRQGKTVIVVNDGTGFYTSRILVPPGIEAMYLIEEGASIEAIDEAMVDWGFPVGPVLLMDEVGIDVMGKIGVIMVDAFGDRMAAPESMAGLTGDDRQGRKNRRGFYTYDDKGKRGDVDETVYEVLGLGPRIPVSTEEIQERISMQWINEAARCLEDGILRSARDGDIGAVMGVGFPPFRGGPFFYADQVGAKEIVAKLDVLADRFGERFQAADILRQHAETGKRFLG